VGTLPAMVLQAHQANSTDVFVIINVALIYR
jgi:hypothetical protein